MSDKKISRALISGGGTGGHIFPALSIANALKRRYPEIEILFVGAENRMEMERVPAAGYPIKGLPVAGFDRKNIFKNLSVLMKLRRSLKMARDIVREFKPDIAIGVGGYASGPTLKAAQRQGVPTVLQEQNSYAGVTNKLLAKKAKAICVAYNDMERFFPEEAIHLTGNPVRKDLTECTLTPAEARAKLGFDPDKPLLLVVGGSLGARTVNEAIASGIDRIVAEGFQLMWQIGKYGTDRFMAVAEGREGVIASPFITDMATAYRAADVVVSRAGAGTISELQILGKAVILVPSPNVSEDHQRKNAEALVNCDAAIMVLDSNAVLELVPAAIDLLKSDAKQRLLSENISKMALNDADEKIVDIIEKSI